MTPLHGIACFYDVGFGARAVSRKTSISFIKIKIVKEVIAYEVSPVAMFLFLFCFSFLFLNVSTHPMRDFYRVFSQFYEVYRRLARHSPRAEANYAIQYNTVPCNTIYKVIKYTKYHL